MSVQNEEFDYSAFISYRHLPEDRKWAKWLLSALETYRTPKALQKQGVPARLGKAFRDEDEIPASADLSSEIRIALEKSNFLIVVCSKETPASKWVGEEIRTFHALGRSDQIIGLLIDGEPDEAFPELLLKVPKSISDDGLITWSDEEREPIAADVRPRDDTSNRELKRSALLRVAASILGVKFDDLKRRDEARQKRKLQLVVAASLAAVVFTSGLSWFAFDQRSEARIQTEAAVASAVIAKQQEQNALASEKEAKNQKTQAIINLELSKKHLRQMQLEKSRFLVNLSHSWENSKGIVTSALVVLAGLPKNAQNSIPEHIESLFRLSTLLYKDWPLLHELKGSEYGVNSVNISPDSKFIVTVSFGKSARVWNVNNGTLRNKLKGHNDWITSVAISSDNSFIVTGSDDKTGRIWDATSGALRRELKGHRMEITSVAVSSDNSFIVTGSNDNTVRIWDVTSGALRSEMKGHRMGVTSVAISSDNRFVVSGSADNTARIWSAKKGSLRGKLMGHRGTIETVAISMNSRFIVTGSADNTARIWDARTGALRSELEGHNGAISSINISDDNKLIVTAAGHDDDPDTDGRLIGHEDSSVRLWNADSGVLLNELKVFPVSANGTN